LDYEGNSVYKEWNYWLVLTRTLLAGFNAHIDTDRTRILRRMPITTQKTCFDDVLSRRLSRSQELIS
jgi:hypothetical protein